MENNLGGTSVNFITCLMPEKKSDGLVHLQGKEFILMLEYDFKRTELQIEKKNIEDSRLKHKSAEKQVDAIMKEKELQQKTDDTNKSIALSIKSEYKDRSNIQ